MILDSLVKPAQENTHAAANTVKLHLMNKQQHCKTNVTHAISLRDFVAQLYRVTKLQYATVHVAHRNFVA